MAATNTPISPDSGATLRGLIGDDASATFESDPGFIYSNDSTGGPSNHLTLRDTDDTEDSDEEEEEIEEEYDDEDEEDEDDDEEDDETEVGSEVLRMAEPINVHGPGKNRRIDIEEELEEMEDEGGVEDDAESVEETEPDGDDPKVDRGIDAALRMRALAAVGSGFAANLRGLE